MTLAAGKPLSAGVCSFLQAVLVFLLAVLPGMKGKAPLEPSGQRVLR